MAPPESSIGVKDTVTTVGLSQAHRPVGARLKLRVAAQDQRAYPRQVADGGHRMLRREVEVTT